MAIEAFEPLGREATALLPLRRPAARGLDESARRAADGRAFAGHAFHQPGGSAAVLWVELGVMALLLGSILGVQTVLRRRRAAAVR